MHSFARARSWFVRFVCSFVDWLVGSFVHACVRAYMHVRVRSLVGWFVRSFVPCSFDAAGSADPDAEDY